MLRPLLMISLATLPLISVTQAQGAEKEEEKASLSVQFSALKWSSTKTKETESGTESEQQGTSLITGDLVDSTLYLTTGKWNFYLYPFQDSNALVSGSYMVLDNLELGLDFGIQSQKVDKPKTEDRSTLFGFFATHFLAIGDNTLESGAVIDATSFRSTSTNPNTNEESTAESSGIFIKLSANYVVPLSKNLWYYGGAWVALQNEKPKSGDDKTATSQFGLTFAGIRSTVN